MEAGPQFRQLSPKAQTALYYATIVIALYHVIYLSGLLELVYYWPRPAFRGVSLASLLTLSFVMVPHTRRRPVNYIPWFDWLFIAAGVIPTIYYSTAYATISRQFGQATEVQQVFGVMLLIAVLELVRRVTTWLLPVVAGLFFVYPFVASKLPGFLRAGAHSTARVIGHLYLFPEGMLGQILDITVGIVYVFILFGAFLQASGASQTFVDIVRAVTGRFRSGPPLTAVLASALMGTVSGSGVANAATTGVITIPLMKRVGLKPHFAAAVEAVASTGGQLMPPVMGAVVFIMADMLRIPLYELLIAAFIPAVLYFLTLSLGVYAEVSRLEVDKLRADEIPRFGNVLRSGWYHFLPLFLLIYLLLIKRMTAEASVFYSILLVIAIMMVQAVIGRNNGGLRRFGRNIGSSLSQSVTGMVEIIAPVVAAGIIMGSISLTGLALSVSRALTALAGDSLLLAALMAAVASIIMGSGLPTLPAYIMVVLLIAPSFVQLGIEPLVAHMFVFYFSLAAMITPPVALTAFVAAGIAQADMMKTAWTAMRLGVGAYVLPFVFLKHPGVLLVLADDTKAMVWGLLVAIAGILAFVFGLSGGLGRTINFNLVQRAMLILAGLFTSFNMSDSSTLYVAAAVLAALALLWGLVQGRQAAGKAFEAGEL